MWIPILWLAVGLVLLIKGGDWFVDGASGIARRFRLPEILIGATVVSIGTTLPEVMVSSGAALQGSGEIAYGNAIGSIICNTSLIAAVTIAIKPGKAARRTMALPVAFFFFAAAVYCICAYAMGVFSRLVGILLLAIFATYMVANVWQMRKNAAHDTLETAPTCETEEAAVTVEEGKSSKLSALKDVLFLVIGAALIAVGADLLVDNAVLVAEHFGVSEKVIGLTIVALGTSLPEFVTAITSLIKGHGSLSLGNIIGANLFNLVFVSGMAVTISPFPVPEAGLIGGYNASFVLDIPVMLGVMAILTIPTLIKQRLYRWQGFLLLGVYAAFCVAQFTI
ncbi:MAG: calcium/sodium antiporter [Clostridia bacterium]|nr:calcium/sodium antiporter [Clostridia bacterium]